MAVEIKVPTVGESISEVTLSKWIKNDGDWVERDEVIAEIESEKATLEISADKAGILHTKASVDEELAIGQVMAEIDDKASKPTGATAAPKPAEPQQEKPVAAPKAAPQPKVEVEQPRTASHPHVEVVVPSQENAEVEHPKATPLAAAIIADKKIDVSQVKGSGSYGKLTKSDVINIMDKPGRNPQAASFCRNEEKKKMTPLRRTISRRLVEAKNSTAMLTTFNEVDMKPVMDIRKKYKEVFKKTHNIGLGFMSFFTKAVCFALQEWPAVNAQLDGDSLIYHDYCDISIAVSSPKGLVVPVIRNAESLSMAEIEKAVADLAVKARESKLTIEEMTGGTFTITNGGVFGSLMSTPILNIPQSAILGMHNIVERPVVIEGKIEIRPMMYIALSYDHRVIDGRESVSFLVRVKQMLESPEQLLFGKDPVKTLLEL